MSSESPLPVGTSMIQKASSITIEMEPISSSIAIEEVPISDLPFSPKNSQKPQIVSIDPLYSLVSQSDHNSRVNIFSVSTVPEFKLPNYVKEYFSKFRGSGKGQLTFLFLFPEIIRVFIVCFLCLSLLGILTYTIPLVDLKQVFEVWCPLVPPFGATAVLLFAMPEAPAAQPRSLIFGSLISSFIGATFSLIFLRFDTNNDYLWLSCALSVSMSISVMQYTRTLHPPGGALALVVNSNPELRKLGYMYLLIPVLLGISVMLLAALLYHNIYGQYPYYWIHPEENLSVVDFAKTSGDLKSKPILNIGKPANSSVSSFHAEALYWLESIQGKPRNIIEAVKCLNKAIMNHDDTAIPLLAQCYFNGDDDFAPDYASALPLLEKAAEMNDVAALNSLGFCYINGLGTNVNSIMAFRAFKRAAAQKDRVGLYNVGVCYENGKGVGRNLKEAVDCYRRSAELGHSKAMLALGCCYENGLGVDHNWCDAVFWYKRGASKRDPESIFRLGRCYEDGFGIEMDLTKALRYYRVAAKLKHSEARDKVKELSTNLNIRVSSDSDSS